MRGSLPVQQWTILWASEQMVWVGWVEVDFPHWRENQRTTIRKQLASGGEVQNQCKIGQIEFYSQRSVPPWVRRVCCLVSRPTRTACRPALQWPQCAAGLDVCPRSAEGLYPHTWQQTSVLESESKSPNTTFGIKRPKQKTCSVKSEEVLQGEDLGRWVVLLSEVPNLELADRVHGQNLCCPQVSHSMNSAAVRIFWQMTIRPLSYIPHYFYMLRIIVLRPSSQRELISIQPMTRITPSWSALKTMILPSSPTVTISGLLHTTPVQGALSQG